VRFDKYLRNQGFTIPEVAIFSDAHLQQLIGIFNAHDGSTPADMIEALFHVSEVANDQGMEALLVVASKTGIELPEGDLTPADLALLIWLYDPDLLRRANCERIVLRFQSFYCFMNRTLEAPTFESPTDQVLNRIEDRTNHFNRNRQRGGGAAVWMYELGHEVAFLIRYGGSLKRDEVMENDMCRPDIRRPVGYDLVHNMTKRNSIVYRYYTCVRAIKRGRQSCRHPSLPAGEIEAAVVDQVRTISRDAGLRDEIIRQAMTATQQGRKEIDAHQIQLARQLTRDHGEIRQLALEERPDSQVSHRIADIQERIEKAELQLAKVNRQLVDLEKQEMSTQEIEDALIDFDRIWDALTTREKSQLLARLVSKVEFDQSDCTIAITFHASGIDTLDQQSQEV